MIKEFDDKPLISVIIPVYQVQEYLERCLNSVITQTYSNLEIILVDDGSKDESGNICDIYADKDSRIKTIHKENGGLSSARNAGLDVMNGRYVTFIDSDDWITPDAIDYLYELLVKYNAEFSMAENHRVGDEKVEYDDTHIQECVLEKRTFLKKLLKIGTQENVQYAWAKLYKVELFENIRYPIGLTAEDVPTTFQIALLADKVAYSTKVIYNYYINPKSITGKIFSKTTFDLTKIWDIICESANRYGDEEIIKYAYLNRTRINFSILMRMALDMTCEEEKIYGKDIKVLQYELRKNLFKLIMADIPFSRKILMVSFSISIPVSFRIIRFVKKNSAFKLTV